MNLDDVVLHSQLKYAMTVSLQWTAEEYPSIHLFIVVIPHIPIISFLAQFSPNIHTSVLTNCFCYCHYYK